MWKVSIVLRPWIPFKGIWSFLGLITEQTILSSRSSSEAVFLGESVSGSELLICKVRVWEKVLTDFAALCQHIKSICTQTHWKTLVLLLSWFTGSAERPGVICGGEYWAYYANKGEFYMLVIVCKCLIKATKISHKPAVVWKLNKGERALQRSDKATYSIISPISPIQVIYLPYKLY